MINKKEIDLLVYGHIYEWVKPKIWNKNISDVDQKNVKDTVYMDAICSKTMYWNNYDEFTRIFNDVKDGIISDADVNVFDNGVQYEKFCLYCRYYCLYNDCRIY